VLILAPTERAVAFEWSDLWVNNNQQGTRNFEQEQFDAAAESFRDPSWRAASNYRRGRYEDVVTELEGMEDAQSHYNRGNALAQLYRLEEAIAAYDQTLALEPDNQDAIHNKQLVENLLEQQQQEQSQEQNENEQQQNDQQQQEQQDQDQSESEQDDQQQQSDQQSEQQDGEPEDQEGEQSQEEQQQDQEQEQQDSQDQEQQQQEMQQNTLSEEEEQSIQQWLGRIQDDPGELLRNKFRQQSQQLLYEQRTNPAQSNQRAQEQIW
jgi:Ca-activated chloride channel family protein